MKALFYTEPGDRSVLQYADTDDPTPGSLDVVIDVAATALNHLDVVQRSGWFTMPGMTLPHIAGMDVVGTVSAVGSEVTRLKVGDRVVVDPSLAEVPEGSKLASTDAFTGEPGVIGATVAGGYAEKCLVPESHAHLLPAEMPWHYAVCFPTSWVTAWHALVTIGRLAAGESVMIHAAGSGLSTAAIQLAKHLDATVLATAGTDEKCERALGLGADFVCNNRTDDITAWARTLTDGVGVHMVFDHVGPALWAQSMFSLRPRGRLINCGNTTGDTAMIPSLGHLFHNGISIIGSDGYAHQEFATAWDVYCAGSFKAPVDSVFALRDGADAQDKMLSSNFFGKIVLEP